MIRSLPPATRLDLHLHSKCSDGRYEQDEVLERAAASGLQLVAITDHDYATPVAPGIHRFGDREIQVIPGAEISGLHNNTEYHLLVYFPELVPVGFRSFCSQLIADRVRRYEATLLNLDMPDLPGPNDAVYSGVQALTRLHLAHALVRTGHARNIRDAFRLYLHDDSGYVPRIELPFVEAIEMARDFGGVTSWAHPSADDARQHLSTFVAAGLQGLEALRPMIRGRDRRVLRRLARAHGLFVTGGSDWHGWNNPSDLGLFAIPARDLRVFLDALSQAA